MMGGLGLHPQDTCHVTVYPTPLLSVWALMEGGTSLLTSVSPGRSGVEAQRTQLLNARSGRAKEAQRDVPACRWSQEPDALLHWRGLTES